MSQVTIGGAGIGRDIQVANDSLFGKAKLTTLFAKSNGFADEFTNPLSAGSLNSIPFSASYESATIALDSGVGLTIRPEFDASVGIARAADSPLLQGGDLTPDIEIGPQQVWVSFSIGGSVDAGAGGLTPGGLGIGVDVKAGAIFTAYELFDANTVLSDAIQRTISDFTVASSAKVIRGQKPGMVLESDLTGSITVGGNWTVPASVNTLALADTPAPVQIEVELSTTVKLQGSISISGEFIFRAWKKNDTQLVIGLYKKKGATLTAGFTASVGMEAEIGTTDLIGKVIGLLSPQADTSVLVADPVGIRDALKASVDHGLTVSLNASVSAAFTNEAAFVYTVDMTRNIAATDAAIGAALRGDWRPIGNLENAEENKNAIAHAVKTNHKLVINVLGIYNYASIAEFMSKCTVVHCLDDGSATITDTETAKRLTVGQAPHQTSDKVLRKALAEAAVATAAYTCTKAGNKSRLTSSQTLVIYKNKANARDLAEALAPAFALGMATQAQIAGAVGGVSHQHALLQFEQKIDEDAAAQMFFDPATGKPWQEGALTRIGIEQLRALLDPNNPDDERRLEFLAQPWPETQPPAPFVVDWLDITWWATSVENASAKYVAAKAAFEKIPPGDDPAAHPDFMKARQELANALLSMQKSEHSGFTPGWPIAVMHRISRGQGICTLTVSWDGKTQLQLPPRTVAA